MKKLDRDFESWTWNDWRDNYESMSTDDQKAYYNFVERIAPSQKSFTYDFVKEAIEISSCKSVLEFGCWKAELANQALSEFEIDNWTGIEICERAIKKTACKSSKFNYIFPEKYDWFNEKRKVGADLVIACHFIEHLSNDHFDSLADYVSGINYIYFEAPMKDGENDWSGYTGTHKLIYGWDDVISKLSEKKYNLIKKYPMKRRWRKKYGSTQGILMKLKP